MIKIRLFLTASLVAAALTTSMAALSDDDKKAEDTKADSKKPVDKTPGSAPNPYSDCGIGAALFKETKWAAVISNIIWDFGLTAITSATASPQTCSGKTVAAALFIHHTYDKLAEEAASGQGEYLTTVLNIFECDSARHANAVLQIRGAMGHAVAVPNYTDQSHIDKAANFYSIVEKAVRASCSA
jgi:Protein of unknown function (DUF3015)